MGLTRRRFLSCAASALTTALPLDVWPPRRPRHAGRPGRSCETVLLDLTRHSGLSEALSGYESALASLGTRFARADPRSVPRCATLIVPGALEIPPPALRAIATCLEAGATVILESGAGFTVGSDFRAHSAMLRDSLQVHLEAPVQLWAARPRSQGIPYVDYTWPHPAKLRDFSRAIPLGRQPGEIIAWVDGLPVALKRQSGPGTLVFLGSPLGPGLWAQDAEARRWLLDVLVSAVGTMPYG